MGKYIATLTGSDECADFLQTLASALQNDELTSPVVTVNGSFDAGQTISIDIHDADGRIITWLRARKRT